MARSKRWNQNSTASGFLQDTLDIFAETEKERTDDFDGRPEAGAHHDDEQPGMGLRTAGAGGAGEGAGRDILLGSLSRAASPDRTGLEESGLSRQPDQVNREDTGRLHSHEVRPVHTGVSGAVGETSRQSASGGGRGRAAGSVDDSSRVDVGGNGSGLGNGAGRPVGPSSPSDADLRETSSSGQGSSGLPRIEAESGGSGRGSGGVDARPGAGDREGARPSYDDAVTYAPTLEVVPPSSARARAQANIAAIKVMRELDEQHRWATRDEQEILAAYSAWGAVPQIFETWREDWAVEQAELSALLTPAEHRAASATTLNAHYTDPAVISAMWSALEGAGFSGGPVLEPGSGSGNFIGQAPASAQMAGVELDPVTARISHYLYPNAHVRAQGFEKTRFTGQFNAVIGNVPYGQVVLHDTVDNPHNLSIHNHFIVKALKNTAPGGYVALLTSSFTMDSSRRTAREEMAKYGQLLGAVRLPVGAMSRVAGTEAMTDIVLFRRYAPGQSMGEFYKNKKLGWLTSAPTTLTHDNGEDVEVPLNQYWTEHPDNVIGSFGVGTGQYNPNTVRVRSELAHDSVALGQAVKERLLALVEEHAATAPYAPTSAIAFAPSELDRGYYTPEAFAEQQVPGTLRIENSRLEVFADGQWNAPRIPRGTTLDEQIKLVQVRDAAVNVLSIQTSGATVEARESARTALSAAYENYTGAYGPLNRFETVSRALSTKQFDAEMRKRKSEWKAFNKEALAADPDLEPSQETVEEWRREISELGSSIKKYPQFALLRDDPEFALVLALENFDGETQSASKALIFSQDIIAQAPSRTEAENPDVAVAISMDEYREVKLDRVAQLLGVDEDEALTQLRGSAFVDPDTEQLIAATQYLSGNVREKLDRALLRADSDPRFLDNVTALQGVVPEALTFDEISIRAGARYIPVDYYRSFSADILKATIAFENDATTSKWRLEGPKRATLDNTVVHEFGTDARNPIEILEAVMNNEQITVSKTVEMLNGAKKTVRNVEATALARETANRLNTAFVHWLGSDATRRTFVENVYNERFNSYVAPDYTQLGAQLQLPGLSPNMLPHPYQRAAAAQIIHEPAVLLDHVVGAGKTGSMIMGAMELRRANLAQKPWMVVPNHLVEQIAKEWKSWYPNAKVMTVGTELSAKQRQQVILKSATGDWDGVIVPASSFGLMGVDGARTARWIEEDIADLREEMARTRAGSPDNKSYIKKVETKIKSLERDYERALDRMDGGYTFEQSGCDYLFVDEAHNYKNLPRESAHQELSHAGSFRARDLDFKMRALRENKLDALERAGKPTEGVIPSVATFATGTPVANSLAEMWVMQRYLRPDELDNAGLKSIDAWAGQFTESESKLELGPDGSTWRMKDRISRFTNVPDLMRMTSQFTSTVTREQIPAALPSLMGGEYALLSRPASEHVKDFVATLAERANNMPKDPSIDNLLKVTHEGRMVAIDPRTLGMDEDPDGGRVHMVATEIMRIHENTKNYTYTDAYGASDPVPGGLQIVFLDRSTPNGSDAFNVYSALRDELMVRGMSKDSIAFIHDAKDDLARDELFANCRSGKVNVLIGSTEKMGTGTNVQKRAIALHHFDVPWRPADLEQREGRILRQGNQNKEVAINRYLTEGTYDAVMWQQVARKAAFIAQLKSGTTSRTLSQVSDDMTISAAAASAIATGDTRIIERAELMHRIEGLETLERAYAQKNSAMRGEIWSKESRLRALQLGLDNQKLAASMYRPSHEDNFTMQIGERVFSDRGEAADALLSVARASRLQQPPTITMNGLSARIAPFNGDRVSIVSFDLAPEFSISVDIDGSRASGVGAIRRLENRTEKVATAAITSEMEIAGLEKWLKDAEDRQESGFTGAEELRELRVRLLEIDTALEMTDEALTAGTPTVSYLSEQESKRLYGEGLANDYVRTNDIVSIKRKAGLWKVITPSNQVVVQREGSDETELVRASFVDVNVERREHASLTPFEQQILAFEDDCVRVSRASRITTGREYLAYVQPVVLGERTWLEDGEPRFVSGTLLSMENEIVEGRRGTDPVMTFEHDGQRVSGYMVGPDPERPFKDHFVAQILHHDPNAEVGIRASRLVPGDILLKSVGTEGTSTYLPLGTQRTPSMFLTPDGREVPAYSAASYMLGPQDFMRGSELSPAQLKTLDLHLEAVPGNEIELGDRTSLFALGAKTALDAQVVVIGTSVLGNHSDITVRDADDYSAESQTVRVSSTKSVAIAGRRVVSLSRDDYAFLFNARKAHSLTKMDAPLSVVTVRGRESTELPDSPAHYFTGTVESYDAKTGLALFSDAAGTSFMVSPVTPMAYEIEPVRGPRRDYSGGVASYVVEQAQHKGPRTQVEGGAQVHTPPPDLSLN